VVESAQKFAETRQTLPLSPGVFSALNYAPHYDLFPRETADMRRAHYERTATSRLLSRHSFCHGLTLVVAALLSCPVLSEEQNVTELSLDDLANAEVISAAKKAQPLAATAAAVYVISRETIRESRATSIPELLRLVPGVNVAQIDGHKWAVSIRGFNARFSKSLLVMVDGRAIYDHTVSGVFWENLALPLEEIERIEVVRSPGGALWGANAVNGIINIITRRATDTLGALAAGAAGNIVEGNGTVRYGAALGNSAYARIYVSAIRHDQFARATASGGDNHDGWERQTGGLRLDWRLTPQDNLTVQADSFDGRFDQRGNRTLLVAPYRVAIEETAHGHGSNVLSRWSHTTEQTGDWQAQLYYDSNQHIEALYSLGNKTWDLDVQHHWPLHRLHELTWGVGYREIENQVSGLTFPGAEPMLRWNNKNLFLSDQMQLSDDFTLTLGAKWENSGLTRDHLAPNLRFNWQPAAGWSFWGAYGEAVRTPNRLENNLKLLLEVLPPYLPPYNLPEPVALFLLSNPQLDQEVLQASELGARWLASDQLSLDLALFRHDYHDVVMPQETLPRFDPDLGLLRIDRLRENVADADSQGVELALHWLPRQRWSSSLSYSYLDLNVQAPAAQTNTALAFEGSAAQHQLSLLNRLALTDDWDLSLWLRWRDELTTATSALDARTDVDCSVGWQYSEQLKLWLAGRNLTGNDEPDFFASTAAKIDRSILLSLRYDF